MVAALHLDEAAKELRHVAGVGESEIGRRIGRVTRDRVDREAVRAGSGILVVKLRHRDAVPLGARQITTARTVAVVCPHDKQHAWIAGPAGRRVGLCERASRP